MSFSLDLNGTHITIFEKDIVHLRRPNTLHLESRAFIVGHLFILLNDTKKFSDDEYYNKVNEFLEAVLNGRWAGGFDFALGELQRLSIEVAQEWRWRIWFSLPARLRPVLPPPEIIEYAKFQSPDGLRILGLEIWK